MPLWKRILAFLVAVVLAVAGWRAYGWMGVAFVATGLVMWILLYFNRTMHVLKQSAKRPIGYVGSAVMLNAKLKPRVNLLHVMAITQSVGEQLSPVDTQPEVFRWTDPGQSSVTCEFMQGRLVKWTLERPQEPVEETASAASPAAH